AVWSTKRREAAIPTDVQARLHAYIVGIAQNIGAQALAVGGIEDHVHLLLEMPPTLTIAKAIGVIKSNSSRWLNLSFPELTFRRWQEGYGAFSIGIAQVDRTIRYIQNQVEHHKKENYAAELRRFLNRHGLNLDPADQGE